ncbi:hypothetical protein Tco_0550895 [Tanacetum coccineum]
MDQSGKSDVYTSEWHNYFSNGSGFWLCIEDLAYYLRSGLSWNLFCNSYLKVADIYVLWYSVIEFCSAGYKDAPGLIWLNKVEQFYSKSGKKQSNTSKANSVIKDKDKDDISATSFKRRQQDALHHGKADGSTIDKKFKAKDGTRTAYDVSLTDDGRTPEIFNLIILIFFQEAYLAPLLPLEILSDKPRESTLGLAKKLLAKYGSLVSVISIVVLFVYLVATPSKSGAAKGSKKKR